MNLVRCNLKICTLNNSEICNSKPPGDVWVQQKLQTTGLKLAWHGIAKLNTPTWHEEQEKTMNYGRRRGKQCPALISSSQSTFPTVKLSYSLVTLQKAFQSVWCVGCEDCTYER